MTIQSVQNRQRLYWIDQVKALCILCVLFSHAMAYYKVKLPWISLWYNPFFVSSFYFVSGYFLIPKCIGDQFRGIIEFKSALIKVLNRIVLPTILFGTLIYIPKILFHNSSLGLQTWLIDALLGNCFWFTSAIAVAQVLILSVSFFLKIKNEWMMFVISSIIAVAGFIISRYDINNTPWFYKSGMLATLFVSLGGLYHRYESKIDSLLCPKYIALFSSIFYILFLSYNSGDQILCGNIGLNYNLLGWIATILGISSIVYCSKVSPNIPFLSFVGRNSLVFYFLSGLIPASVSTLALKLIPVHNWVILAIVYIFVIVLVSIAAFIINRYFSFLLDIRTISKRKSA